MSWRKYWFEKLGMVEFCPSCECDCTVPPFPQPSVIGNITGGEIDSLLDGALGVYYADRDYKTISKVEFEKWLAHDELDKEKYVSEYYDCDDFAHDLVTYAKRWIPGLAIGEFWTYNHAMNIFVDIDRRVWKYEPQTDGCSVLDISTIKFMRF